MDEKEKSIFESELKNSVSLQKELAKYRAVYNEFSGYKDVKIESDYFRNLVPRFRSKLSGEIIKFPLPKFAFGSAALVVVIMFLFILLNRNGNVSNVTDSVNENELTELLNHYSSDFSLSEIPNDAVVDSTINALYLNEINVSPEAESYYFAERKSDLSTIVKDINTEESDNIYNEIINKKYF